MTEAEFREQLKAEGYPEAGKHNALHAHDFTAKGLILEGAVTISTDSEQQVCVAGDTFYMASGTPHEEKISNDGAKLLVGKR